MAATLLFHHTPRVVVDASTPVTRWSLSVVGRRRLLALMRSGALDAAGSIFSSSDQKALDAAALVSEHIGTNAHVVPELDENDRSSPCMCTKLPGKSRLP